MSTSGTAHISWEYLMPKPKERMAGYIRFSDPSMPLDAATMDSQAKAIRQYAEKEGYLYDPRHEYREAISAYQVPYLERKTLLEVIEAARRKEFTVLVVTEIRSFSRRQVEVFVLYDILQKYGCRLETISEKFEDSAIGRYILATRAMIAEVERENTYARLQRGKLHRLEEGNINGHNKSAFGYVFIDTLREVKAAYAFNTAVFSVGGKEWTEVKVVEWIYDRALEGWAIKKIAVCLTEMGIPSPHAKKVMKGKPVSQVWHPSTVHMILTNSIYMGTVYANRFQGVENTSSKKVNTAKRSRDEWIKLPDGIAPPIVTEEVFTAVQKQLQINKEEALRRTDPNTPKDALGLLRSGFAKCGVCGRNMQVLRRGRTYNGYTDVPQYMCKQKYGGESVSHNHVVAMTVASLDQAAFAKIREIIRDPNQVRQKVAKRREKVDKPVVTQEGVDITIANIQAEIDNLVDLARHAANEKTRQKLGRELEDLENRQRQAESLLLDIDDGRENAAKLEAEIVRFEQWAHNVRPLLDNPEYVPSYDELRLAVRIIGIRATVYPKHGDYPGRCIIDADPPEVIKYIPSSMTALSLTI